MFPPIPCVLWVHVQGMTHLGHNQYTGILFIRALEHSSCGTRSGKNCKISKLSSGLSMLLREEPQDMDILSTIPPVLWVHDQGLANLGHNKYTRILFIQASLYP